MATDESVFTPQFTAEFISGLGCGYLKRSTRTKVPNVVADESALEAGRKIKEGDRSKNTLKKISYWKNSDSRFWTKLERDFDRNSSADIAGALATAVDSHSGAVAVAALTKLSGVGVPTTSAILTAIHRYRYTVIDQLALRALGIENSEMAFYLLYNAACRELASASKVTLRTLDRALWEWGKTHQPKRGQRKLRLKAG